MMKITVILFVYAMSLHCQSIDKKMIIGNWGYAQHTKNYDKMIRVHKDSTQKVSIIFFEDGKLSRFSIGGPYDGAPKTETKHEKWYFKNDSVIYFTYKDRTFKTYKIKEVTDSTLYLETIKTKEEKIIGRWKHVDAKKGHEKMIRIYRYPRLLRPGIIFLRSGRLARFLSSQSDPNKYRETQHEKWHFKNDSILYFTHKDSIFATYKLKKLTEAELLLEKINSQKISDPKLVGVWYITHANGNKFSLQKKDTVNRNYVYYQFKENGLLEANLLNHLWDNPAQPLLYNNKGFWKKNLDTITLEFDKNEEIWLIKKMSSTTLEITKNE
ncbi:hypothetical protein [Tenacibaculum agarivorans]|uniref:hypothetical protein n=1 Tax=Tenacibaculum agarivorans TaxID=1908389 RepID=UPI00094BA897|nr:hypothetical protein [Tenacibaculum agarivorans]